MLLQATMDWHIKIPGSVVLAVAIVFPVALVGLVLFISRRDRRRRLARQPKAGN